MKKTSQKYIILKNVETIEISSIPILKYADFKNQTISILTENDDFHCVQYLAIPLEKGFRLLMIIANDETHQFYVYSPALLELTIPLEAISKEIFALQIFEREIHENFNIQFVNHPWLKPVRYAYNRTDKSKKISNYPFYSIKGNELHEVSVGPIHAGIIEPGHFKFLCNGEMVMHLEIQHGYQHRGIENLLLTKPNWLAKTVLAESITADSAIGHNYAFVNTIEALSDIKITSNLQIERSIALELERIAIHTGDLCGMCTDVAYQLGSSVFNALRTPIINFTQKWCGNRFGKGLVRIGGTHYPLTDSLKQEMLVVLNAYEPRFREMGKKTLNLPSILKRFDGIGAVTKHKLGLIGVVGMVAKTAGFKRDMRFSHPIGAYNELDFEPELCNNGDVMSRAVLRYREVKQSIELIKFFLKKHVSTVENTSPIYNLSLKPNSFGIGAIEGWRGEIVHTAFTDENGQLKLYKIKDPSMHNWKALELSLRNLEISDFPINNKSYDLSYSGFDL